jgi:hypothetical protein
MGKISGLSLYHIRAISDIQLTERPQRHRDASWLVGMETNGVLGMWIPGRDLIKGIRIELKVLYCFWGDLGYNGVNIPATLEACCCLHPNLIGETCV